MQYADGGSYQGEWDYDCYSGSGVKTFPNGFKFDGEFENDYATGEVNVHYPSGKMRLVEFTLKGEDFDEIPFLCRWVKAAEEEQQ